MDAIQLSRRFAGGGILRIWFLTRKIGFVEVWTLIWEDDLSMDQKVGELLRIRERGTSGVHIMGRIVPSLTSTESHHSENTSRRTQLDAAS